jgi:hypothetical protein
MAYRDFLVVVDDGIGATKRIRCASSMTTGISYEKPRQVSWIWPDRPCPVIPPGSRWLLPAWRRARRGRLPPYDGRPSYESSPLMRIFSDTALLQRAITFSNQTGKEKASLRLVA